MSEIILFRGKAGTGKTTLSDGLAGRLRIPVLHKDDLYDAAAAHVPEHGDRNAICFDFLYRFLAHAIRSGASVIVDYGFNRAEDAGDFALWVSERGARLLTIRCVCSDETVWAARLAERRVNPLPNQRITDLDELKAHYNDSDSVALAGELVVDTAMRKEDVMPAIETFVRGEARI